ncbi:hypothetical protein H072_1001 [Dactylellina haptotyla CBS 200.50]|uniref:Extracellular membrane protein CFEM domain-containing protein n=1 Tax=Dactylellina haptotyla (strain CBS 200.50) TaxID=1284197 RepID=S8BZZ7_DACHA|nr:hypothetical protein H072_1001 [Dactylellina haptotyla CBS 200.50]
MLAFSALLFFFTTIIPPATSIASDGPQTLDRLPSYVALRGCAQSCFWSTSPGLFRSDLVASYLSCSQTYILDGALESCWCRSDYQGDVVNYISTCVSSMCESLPGDYVIDVERATSLYRGYCSSVITREGGTVADMTITPASSNGGAQETGRGFPATVTVTATETVYRSRGIGPGSTENIVAKTSTGELVPSMTTAPSGAAVSTTTESGPKTSAGATSGRPGSGLSTGAITGISVGVAIAVIVAVGWGIWCGWFKALIHARRRNEGSQGHINSAAVEECRPVETLGADGRIVSPRNDEYV